MSDHLESCGGAPWDVTNAAKNPRSEPRLELHHVLHIINACAGGPNEALVLAGTLAVVATVIKQRDAAETALESLLKHYVRIAESGDCGFWNPEGEPVVQQARAALAATPEET